MKTCRDVMTRQVVFGIPEDTVDKIARMMKANDIGPIPIVKDEVTRKLVGIVTDRDLVVNVLAQGRDPYKTRAAEVMTANVVTCQEGDSLDKALNAMSAYQVRRIPVVNSSEQIVGIISQADIATRAETPVKTAEVVQEISKPEAAGAGRR